MKKNKNNERGAGREYSWYQKRFLSIDYIPSISVTGTYFSGNGTPTSPLNFLGVITDGETISGKGTIADPLKSKFSGASLSQLSQYYINFNNTSAICDDTRILLQNRTTGTTSIYSYDGEYIISPTLISTADGKLVYNIINTNEWYVLSETGTNLYYINKTTNAVASITILGQTTARGNGAGTYNERLFWYSSNNAGATDGVQLNCVDVSTKAITSTDIGEKIVCMRAFVQDGLDYVAVVTTSNRLRIYDISFNLIANISSNITGTSIYTIVYNNGYLYIGGYSRLFNVDVRTIATPVVVLNSYDTTINFMIYANDMLIADMRPFSTGQMDIVFYDPLTLKRINTERGIFPNQRAIQSLCYDSTRNNLIANCTAIEGSTFLQSLKIFKII